MQGRSVVATRSERDTVMHNGSVRDTNRTQRRTRTQSQAVACRLREISDKIDQGGRHSGLEILPELHQILPQGKTDDQIQPRTRELISTHLREIARRGLRTDALETVYAVNDVTAEMQYQSQLYGPPLLTWRKGKLILMK
jgi:hypothetical protein